MNRNGFRIVLTADRTLMSSYSTLFDGMVAASQTNTIPGPIFKGLIAPSVKTYDDKRVVSAPLGLRRLEAALAKGGFDKNKTGIFRPSDLSSVIGRDTEIVAVSSGDPLGLGMNSSTMEALYGGKIYNKIYFKQIAKTLFGLKKKGYNFKIVFGGPGAWQLLNMQEGIDHLITGYSEGNAAQLFNDIINNKAKKILSGKNVTPENVPPIIGASNMGVVEISRGCGLGCDYCTIKNIPMMHIPVKTIISDINTNIAGGIENTALISEDFFRYGAKSISEPNPSALLGLLTEVRAKTKVKLIQTDHVNIASAGAYTDDELKETASLISGNEKREYIWLNLGVETPSEKLLINNKSQGKMITRGGKSWEDFSLEQIARLSKFGYFPLVSVIMGLPGETEENVLGLERFVDKLKDQKASVFPLYFTATENNKIPEINKNFGHIYSRIMRKGYALNLKWVPKMHWENQRIAGVKRARMLLLQCLGRGQRFIMRY